MLQYSPKIVTDSLVMCLDASNNKSYPTDLPVKNGLVMWMDAADDTTFSYSSGTTVSQWRDKSGFNYHMVPVSAGPTRNAFLNSRKVLAFTTTQQIWNSSINLVTSAYTVFCVTRLTGTTNARVLSTQYTGNTGGNWLLGHWAGNYNQYFAEGWIAYGGYAADTTWRMYMGDWGGPSNDIADAFSNGTSIRNQPSADASAGPLGLGININSETSTCEAAEIIVFNRILSTTERKLVHTYLGQKWGISNTDRSIVDLAGNDDNGLFGNGTVANMPLYDYYNKGTFKFFASNKYIKLGISTVVNQFAGDFSVSLWAMATAENANYGNLIGDYYTAGTPTTAEWQIMMNNSSAFLNVYRAGTGYIINNVSSGFSANTWINVVLTRVGTAVTLYANNNVIGTATNSSIFGSATGSVNIGIDGNNAAEPFSGLISNVLIYRKGLSAAEVAQNYEAQKSKFANTIVQQGLMLHLDAENPYSYAGAGTVWYDVSGNNNYFQLTNSPAFISTEPKTFNLSGASQHFLYYASIGAPTGNTGLALPSSNSWTCAFWFRTSTTNSNRNSLLSHMGSGPVYALMGVSNSVLIYYHYDGNNGGWLTKSATTNVADNNWRNAVFVNTNNTMTIYLNGVLEKSSFSSTATNANNYVNALGGSWESGFFTGSISTFVYYNTNLSAAQVLQNYNATKGRFGL